MIFDITLKDLVFNLTNSFNFSICLKLLTFFCLYFMNILLLGDVMGPAGRKVVAEQLPNIIKKKKVDFVILNGENAADPGAGITKEIFEEFFFIFNHITSIS